VKPFTDGVNKVSISAAELNDKVEVAFVVDSIGSIAVKLGSLHTELLDVINHDKTDHRSSTATNASVFIPGSGDDYFNKSSLFTSDITSSANFIQA